MVVQFAFRVAGSISFRKVGAVRVRPFLEKSVLKSVNRRSVLHHAPVSSSSPYVVSLCGGGSYARACIVTLVTFPPALLCFCSEARPAVGKENLTQLNHRTKSDSNSTFPEAFGSLRVCCRSNFPGMLARDQT